jgi:hypothetical protein
MTWKSYTVVSGATVLAGWLAAQPPSSAPTGAPVDGAARAIEEDAAQTNIEQEAARLGTRVRQEIDFQRPARNPFRFTARTAGAVSAAPAPEPREPVATVPVAPPFRLSGIAEDQIGERTERRAILSSLGDVLIVSEGDQLPGQFRVGRIDEAAVELINVADGSVTRLTLR